MKRRAVINFHRSFFAAASPMLLVLVIAASAAPHNGEEFGLRQPDGSDVRVIVWGDEFFQDVESPDGYTLIRDENGWICYAKLSADGSEYVSTGVRYSGSNSRAPGTQKKIRINRESFQKKHLRAREAVGYSNEEMVPRDMRRRPRVPGGFAPAPAEARKMVGLAVLIDFSDQSSSVSLSAMEDFFNKRGGFNNAASGSVYDYFYDVSNGQLEYTNVVAPFVTADSTKAYYDRGTEYQYVPALLQSALARIKELAEGGELDLSGVSTEGANNTVMALNVYYAGWATQGWANGIWPHQGNYRAPSGQTAVTIDVGGKTIRFGRYQLSSLGNSSNPSSPNPPAIGTTVHENGHMIMRWSDLYSYDNTALPGAVGGYCVMGSAQGNPQRPNPHFMERAGWMDVIDITGMDATLTHNANGFEVYKYVRNSKESYYIEARRRTGRSATIPGEGLIIWHIHTDGRNTELNAANPFPLVKVIQANNANSTATAFPPSPTASAPFRAGTGANVSGNTEFHKTSSPAARYHDGTMSNMHITEISALNTSSPEPSMTFKAGGGPPPVYSLTVVNGSGSGEYEPGDKVTITVPPANSADRPFLRWTSSDVTPENIYAGTTTVTMGNFEATVTAAYSGNSRVYAVPGSIEIDTFALAQGITSATATASYGATGNRTGRATVAGNFAEYVVDIEEDGDYELSYRVLTARTTSGSFLVRDVINDAVFDTVNIPNAPTNTSVMQTLKGKTASFKLKKGRAIWRLEVLSVTGSNINIDWIEAAHVDELASVAGVGSGAPLEYGIRAAPSGKVRFSVPSAGRVSVKMYDIRGRQAAVLCDGVRGPGVYSVNVAQVGGVSQGLYIIRMKSGGYSRDVKVHYNK